MNRSKRLFKARVTSRQEAIHKLWRKRKAALIPAKPAVPRPPRKSISPPDTMASDDQPLAALLKDWTLD